jgi:Spy/CpxP family protein refolding chaperone
MNRISRKHIAAFLLASSTALGIASVASAQDMPGGHMGRHGGSMMNLRGLNLTQAQRDQVFKIYHDQAPAVHEQMKQVQAAREQLNQLAAGDRFDETQARQAADAQAKALSNLAVLRAQTLYRVRELLTPEQRQQLDQRRNDHRRPA